MMLVTATSASLLMPSCLFLQHLQSKDASAWLRFHSVVDLEHVVISLLDKVDSICK